MNPYRVLGITKGTSKGRIERAFREKSMEHHPDRNPGDEQAVQRFAEVTLAYEVLTDPERRAKFDRTGEIDPTVPDNSHQELTLGLQQSFSRTVVALVSTNQNPNCVDVVKLMKSDLRSQIAQIRQAMQQVEIIKKRFEAMLPKYTGECNLLEQITRSEINTMDRETVANQARIVLFEKCLAYLEKCGFTPEGQTGFASATSAMSGVRFIHMTVGS